MGHKKESAPIVPDHVLLPLPTSNPSQSGSYDHKSEAGLTEKPLHVENELLSAFWLF